MSADLFHELSSLAAEGRTFVVATVVSTSGSTPQKPGSRMVVLEDGQLRGTVGGGAIEQQVVEAARALLQSAQTHRLLQTHLTHELGMCCGGTMQLFLEKHVPAARLWVFGAGHVARELAQLAGQVGFRVTVVDGRPEWATAERFPAAARVVRHPATVASELPGGADCYFCVMTHDHPLDQEVVEALLQKEAAYVGVIGSRRKAERFRQRLLAAGGGRDGGSVPGFTAANTCAQVNSAQCAALQRCGLVAEGAAALRECAAFLVETSCGPSLWPARVAAGTLRLMPSVAYACTQAWTVRPCDLVTEAPDVCGGYLQPAAGSGGSCYGGAWTECPAGEVCRGLACPRNCRQPGNAGEDCASDNDCATGQGLYCQLDGDGTAGACAAPSRVGETCGGWMRCAPGLFCNDAGACEPRHAQRLPCSEDGQCLETLFCATASGESSATCQQRVPDGAGCARSGQCRPGSACVPQSGTCAPRGPLPVGTDCGTGQVCAPGLTCVGRTVARAGICIQPLPEGTPCLHAADCESHLSCLPATGPTDLRCGRRLPTGLPCAGDRDCQFLSACLKGACAPLPSGGEPCAGHGCLYGSCAAQPDGGSACAGLLGPNAPCAFNGECSSGRCASGACLAACTP